MFRFFILLFISFSISVQSFDFTGKWELDKEKTKDYLKKIGADPLSSEKESFKIAINKNAVRIDGEQYAAFKFKLGDRECLVFYRKTKPVLVSPSGDKIEVLNFYDAPVICEKKSSVKIFDYSVKGLEGKWNFKKLEFLEFFQKVAGVAGRANIKPVLENTDFLELEFRKNSICLYFSGFPIPFISENQRLEIIRDSEKDFQIIITGFRGIKTSIKIHKIDDKNLKLTTTQPLNNFHLKKSVYQPKSEKFTKEYIQKELKNVLTLLDDMNIPEDDDYVIAEKEGIKAYIYILLEDKPSLMKIVDDMSRKITDKAELSYFYESVFLDIYSDMSLKESVEFYEKYLKPLKGEANLISTYLSLAEKCFDEKHKDAEMYLSLGEQEVERQLELAKKSEPEDQVFEFETYYLNRAYLLYAYNHMGKKDKVNFKGAHPMVKVFYDHMIGEDFRLEGKLKAYQKALKKSRDALNHLSNQDFATALIDFGFYIDKFVDFNDYILPWKKLKRYEDNEAVDRYDKGLVFMSFAIYHFEMKRPAKAYYYLYNALKNNDLDSMSGISAILGSMDNGQAFRLMLMLSRLGAEHSSTYFLSDYVNYLHGLLEDMEIIKKKN